jgi:hypothetical protein
MFLATWEPTCATPLMKYLCPTDNRIYGTSNDCKSTCGVACTSVPGNSLAERVQAEFEKETSFTRALASNFSKPTLIWKFHFPDGTQCADPGVGNYDTFMNYTFTHIGDMVDASIIGLIYDSWMMQNGTAPGNPTTIVQGRTVGPINTVTGFENTPATGALDVMGSGKETTPFCSLQEFSKEIIKLQRYTYGQKMFAGEEACECVPCTDSDYAMGFCFRVNNPKIADQLYCNDGTECTLPAGAPAASYKCPFTCMNVNNCEPCADTSEKSFCKIDRTWEPTIGKSMELFNITDLYWEFLAGLPAKDKCCLVKEQGASQPDLLYTYVERNGVKSQSEFLQYPTRGETGIDCGRVPNTDVLKYCGISIPISQLQVDCSRIK